LQKPKSLEIQPAYTTVKTTKVGFLKIIFLQKKVGFVIYKTHTFTPKLGIVCIEKGGFYSSNFAILEA
jgi:hypothetical protein